MKDLTMIDRSQSASNGFLCRNETLESTQAMSALQQIIDMDASVGGIWSAEKIRDSLTIPGTLLRIACRATGEFGGFYLIRHSFETMELFYIFVAPPMRQMGLGRRLMDDLRTQARQVSEVLKVFLEVRPSNKTAIGLYESFGFQPRSTRRKYYTDGEDALIYEWEVVN